MDSPGAGQRIWLLALVSAVAGLVLAAIMLPVVGGLGLVAKAGAKQFEQLPTALQAPPLPTRSRILAADGSTLATFYYRNRITVDHLHDIAPSMRQAIIAIEDARFYQHGGVDPKGIARAAWADATHGKAVQGASTITQQYVRYVLVEKADTKAARQAARASTISRKLREARYAVALENRLSKKQILLRYLNIAYFGDGAYGVATAAQHYFGVPASKLSVPQSALLAGLVQNPSAYDPRRHPHNAGTRRDTVLRAMRQQQMITKSKYQRARNHGIDLHIHAVPTGCEHSSAPFFCDYVRGRFLHDKAFGATRNERSRLLHRGGLTIKTTLDPKVEKAAQKAVRGQVDKHSRYVGAEAAVQPGTGKVKAIAISRPYGSGKGHTRIDYAVNKKYGGGPYRFPAGSTFKMFVLTAALEKGIPLGYTIHAPYQLSKNQLEHGFVDCKGTQQHYKTKSGKGPHNAVPGEAGTFTLAQATVHSVNTYYVKLEQRIGTCKPFRVATSMGVTQGNGQPLDQVPSFTLGTDDVSPLTIGSAFATLAAKGKYCAPYALTSVKNANGKAMHLPKHKCKQVIPKGLAATVAHVLKPVLTKGTAHGKGIGRPAAGKTGTTDHQVSAWFTGFTPRLAASVVYVDPDAPNKKHSTRKDGGELPAGIWQQTMKAALAGTKPKHFGPLDKKYVKGRKIDVPDVSGEKPPDAKKTLRKAGLSPHMAGTPVDSYLPAGKVDHTSPPAGSEVFAGETIRIYVSDGTAPPPEPAYTPPPPEPAYTPAPQGGTGNEPTAPNPPAPSSQPPPRFQPAPGGDQQGHGHEHGHGHGHGPGNGPGHGPGNGPGHGPGNGAGQGPGHGHGGGQGHEHGGGQGP